MKQTPVSLSRYMELCLYHSDGYYNRFVPIGVDYTTSPEISHMFGQVLAFRLIQIWETVGSPEKVSLVELGPGHGTLMVDMLEAMKQATFFESLEVHMVEISSKLRAVQAENLYLKKIHWHEELPEKLDGFVMIMANEFFDALPVDQYILKGDGWHMKYVDVESKAFIWKKAPGLPPITNGQLGKINEFSSQAVAIAKKLGNLADVMLIVDYGYCDGVGDTVQAMAKGKRVSVLSNPGECDITAHVNFGLLKEIWTGMSFKVDFQSQRQFLLQNGIKELFYSLCGSAQTKGHLAQEYARLTGPMGNLFKVLTSTLPS